MSVDVLLTVAVALQQQQCNRSILPRPNTLTWSNTVTLPCQESHRVVIVELTYRKSLEL